MWRFGRKDKNSTENPAPTLLRVVLGPSEQCRVTTAELPADKQPVIQLSSGQLQLDFHDSSGKVRSFDLSSAYDEGGRFLNFSIRVSQTFAVQPDCIVTATAAEDPQDAFNKGAKAIRFQPFMLPQFTGDQTALMGKGLFFRGLHYSGTITRGNVSALCICDYCDRSFRLQSFHAGFSNLSYLYCSDGPHTLVVSSCMKDAPPIMGPADMKSVVEFEHRLPKCRQCGGSFAYLNPLLCPHCRKPFIDFRRFPQEREKEYYGNYLYGTTLQEFKEATP